ncbi:hypothetical protein Bbelb_342420 [Branchiostoma belcheri]|nr:hypothetical protein Bbelb_342420 [Branchiostoma belcheri]
METCPDSSVGNAQGCKSRHYEFEPRNNNNRSRSSDLTCYYNLDQQLNFTTQQYEYNFNHAPFDYDNTYNRPVFRYYSTSSDNNNRRLYFTRINVSKHIVNGTNHNKSCKYKMAREAETLLFMTQQMLFLLFYYSFALHPVRSRVEPTRSTTASGSVVDFSTTTTEPHTLPVTTTLANNSTSQPNSTNTTLTTPPLTSSTPTTVQSLASNTTTVTKTTEPPTLPVSITLANNSTSQPKSANTTLTTPSLTSNTPTTVQLSAANTTAGPQCPLHSLNVSLV